MLPPSQGLPRSATGNSWVVMLELKDVKLLKSSSINTAVKTLKYYSSIQRESPIKIKWLSPDCTFVLKGCVQSSYRVAEVWNMLNPWRLASIANQFKDHLLYPIWLSLYIQVWLKDYLLQKMLFWSYRKYVFNNELKFMEALGLKYTSC